MKPPRCIRHIGIYAWLLMLFSTEAVTLPAAQADALMADIAFEMSAPYYQPQLAIVAAGMPVRWSNGTASPHSIRHDGCLTDGLCAFNSVFVPPDNSFAIAPLPPGRYPYHCELHPIMRGTLVVIESPQGTIGSEIPLPDSIR